jgi:hypothetical protein
VVGERPDTPTNHRVADRDIGDARADGRFGPGHLGPPARLTRPADVTPSAAGAVTTARGGGQGGGAGAERLPDAGI